MKTINRIIISICMAGFIGICGALILFNWSATGWKALAIPTTSMKPDIPPGSMVFVHRVPIATLKVGDVITYINPLQPRKTLSHRIIKSYMIDGRIHGYVTKGDNNKSTDVPITSGLVIGKVVWHVPYMGYPLIWLKSPLGTIILIDIPALFIMVEEVRRLSSYYKLSQPYRVRGYESSQTSVKRPTKLNFAIKVTIFFIFVSMLVAPQVDALLRSNIVTLSTNKLSVKTPTQCSGPVDNNTTINISNSNPQTAKSGDSSSTGGTANSGTATNNSSTNFNVTVTNC